MSLRIATNIQSLAAQRNLANNRLMQDKSMERMSSGSRINRSGDDAAGMAISEKLRSNIRSLKQANRNANDGISLIQTAEGAMTEVGNILTRLRELSIQGASDTIGDSERGFIDKEVQQLKSEVTRISQGTEFNGMRLLNGTQHELEFQVGMRNDAQIDRFHVNTETLNATLEALGITEVSTSSKESAQMNLEKIDQAIQRLNDSRSTLGSYQNRLQSTINNLTVYTENLATANSRIRDTDMAEETSEFTKSNILTQANISVLSQANQTPQMALKLLG